MKCVFSIHTGVSGRPVEIIYQWWSCGECGARYFGILEESKVNILSDSLEHAGYLADPVLWDKTLKWAKACRKPREPSCGCTVHQTLPGEGFTGTSAWYTVT